MKPVCALPVLGLFVVLSAWAQPAPAQGLESGRLDSLVRACGPRAFMGAVLVARDDRVLLDRGYGFANLEWGVPNTPGTRFRIGSLTKEFTAAAVMLLVERGVLRTSDPIRRWVPDAGPVWDRVTIRHLLSHTSGMTNIDAADELWPSGAGRTPGQMAVLRFRDQPLEFEPGENFLYSNTGYLVLGYIVEAASHMTYEEFVRRNILEPLGLVDTGFDQAGQIVPRRASGYVALRDSVANAPYLDVRLVNAAGGLYSTTRDLIRWQRALLGGKLLKPATLDSMTTPAHGDYAYGIHHRLPPAREAFYHSGRINGFDSVLGYYPGARLAIVVLSNLDAGMSERVFNQLAKAALEEAASPPEAGRSRP